MNAIQYSYDVPQDPNKVEPEGIPTVEQAEEEYIPPPILDVPVDIAIVSFIINLYVFLGKFSFHSILGTNISSIFY